MTGDWWLFWTGICIGLALLVAGAICAAHIPGIAALTGAVPLDKENTP